MKLHLSKPAGLNLFTSYGAGYVLVNGARHEHSLIVLPDRLIDTWPVQSFDGLTAEHIGALVPLECEVVLLGTGARIRFPRPEVLRPLVEASIGVEVMDIAAACRTYNILVAEDRRVAAALILG